MTMASTLRQLSESGTFMLMQEKMDKWNGSYRINSTDQNISSCVEVIELVSRLQSQLFSLLNLCALEGGEYAGCDALKTRLLPWLSSGFIASSGRLSTDTSLSILADSAEKEKQMESLQDVYEKQLDQAETNLNVSRSLTDELSAKVASLQEEVNFYKNRTNLVDDYEFQTRRLQDELALLREEKTLLSGRSDYILAPSPTSRYSSSDSFQRIRQGSLISRFSDLFVRDRMDAMDVLYNHSSDHELNQKTVFTCVQEAFHAVKSAFNHYQTKVYAALQESHTGPETLSEAVQGYINKNGQLLDVHSIVEDVLAAMNRHPVISFPAEVNFRILTVFIREAVKVAWSLTALPSPIDIAPAREGEVFSEKKYRRTRDSEYTAPLVAYYIWPALVDARGEVLLKGEAVTRRGGALASPRRSKSPSRLSVTSRSRSPSPRRSTSPRHSTMRSISPIGSRAGSSMSPRPGSVGSSSLSIY